MTAFEVEGPLLGQAKALLAQKNADNLINVISSDKMGTFPDLNAAEALKRLPGVSLFLSGGEGRYVSIRGARPNYNGTLVNGFTIPSGDSSERRTDLQTISNALIQTIEVTKAVTADLPAEGIGGVTNIIMRSPTDLEHNYEGRVSTYYGWNEYGKNEDREDISIGRFLDRNHRYAIQIAANHRFTDKYSWETGMSTPSLVPGSGGSQVWLTPQVQQVYLQSIRHNTGVDFSLGAKVGDNTQLTARTYYSHFWNPIITNQLTYANIASYKNPDGSVAKLANDGGLVTARTSRTWRSKTWDQRLYGYQFTGKTALPFADAKLDYGYAHARSTERYYDDINIPSAVVTITDPFSAEFTDEVTRFNPTGPNATAAQTNASIYRINTLAYLAGRNDNENESVPYINLTKTFPMKAGSLDVKGGFYGRLRKKGTGLTNTSYTQLATGNLTYADLGSIGTVNDYDEKGIVIGSIVDKNVSEFVRQNNPAAFNSGVLTRTPGDPASYLAFEDIYAGYLMGTYRQQNLTIIGGVRDEQTNEDYRRTSVTGGPFNKSTDKYNHVMPSVHVKYAIMKDMYLRASWTNTVARPDADSIYGVVGARDDTNLTITVPNPALKPLTSENYDVSFDWYTGTLGQFMVGAFSKDIKNFPFSTIDQVTINGLLYTRTSVQARATGKLSGWEASFRREFDFLPSPFNGLGLEVNYAGLKSELRHPLRPDNPRLELQPDYVLNGSLYYGYRGLFLRLALAEQGKSVERSGTSTVGPQLDKYNTARSQWDFTTSYDFGANRKYQVFVEWRNITNAANVYYWGDPSRLAGRATFGSRYGGGVRWRY